MAVCDDEVVEERGKGDTDVALGVFTLDVGEGQGPVTIANSKLPWSSEGRLKTHKTPPWGDRKQIQISIGHSSYALYSHLFNGLI